MKIKILIIAFFFCQFFNSVNAQYHIAGFVKDQQTGERLIGANVIETGTSNGVSTNNYGYFSLITKKGKIQISFIGYKTVELNFTRDTLVHVQLEAGEMLEEIVVKSELSKRFNVTTLSRQEILSIPSLGGKSDVMKALQLMPGIQSQQEGSSLLNVRGGNPGENLYLIDNVPLIYVNHLGGFMSVFNPEMINDMEVYKGGFPAKYGGKLSSIVSITQREGDNSKTKGSFSIGVTDASFSVEGPLLNKKASFIVTGRKTLIDPLMILISGLSNGGDFYVFYGFHDINGKLSYHPDNKNNFYLNIYQGDDYINYWNKKEKITDESFRLSNIWGNWLVSARWNRLFSPRLFADNTISYTRYRLNILNSYYSKTTSDTIDYNNKYTSSVQDVSLRSDWQFKFMQGWDIDYGAKASHYTYIPNKTTQNGETTNLGFDQINAVELSLYLNNRFSLFNRIDGDVGVRLVNYNSEGLNELALEPRLMLNAQIVKGQTLNFTFQKVNQFSHLAFTSGSILSNEVWIPAGEDIAPSNSIQYSLGWKGSFFNSTIETEANAYYKELNQLATYKEGYSNLLGDGGWLNKIETGGTGKAKGIELLIRKVKGKWTGFLGYTLSKSTRKYPGINKGEEYVFEYDRPHSLSFNISHKFNDKWSVNASWVYQSGIPYTPVIGRLIAPSVNEEDGSIEYTEAFIYGERNSERMKAYHRLDIGANLTTKTKKGRKAVWTFSVYNVYNRHNPAAYYYGSEDDTFFYRTGINTDKPTALYQISYFPIIPTVSYKCFLK